jgi:hypothetical protein
MFSPTTKTPFKIKRIEFILKINLYI